MPQKARSRSRQISIFIKYLAIQFIPDPDFLDFQIKYVVIQLTNRKFIPSSLLLSSSASWLPFSPALSIDVYRISRLVYVNVIMCAGCTPCDDDGTIYIFYCWWCRLVGINFKIILMRVLCAYHADRRRKQIRDAIKFLTFSEKPIEKIATSMTKSVGWLVCSVCVCVGVARRTSFKHKFILKLSN